MYIYMHMIAYVYAHRTYIQKNIFVCISMYKHFGCNMIIGFPEGEENMHVGHHYFFPDILRGAHFATQVCSS